MPRMTLGYWERKGGVWLSAMRAALAAVLVAGLSGALFHHHESDSDCAVCSLCHVGVQAPVIGLADALTGPLFAAIGFVNRVYSCHFARAVQYSTISPRAPPEPPNRASFREECAGTGPNSALHLSSI